MAFTGITDETEVLYSTVCKSLVILEATSWHSENKYSIFERLLRVSNVRMARWTDVSDSAMFGHDCDLWWQDISKHS